jgi:hypothetical protein
MPYVIQNDTFISHSIYDFQSRWIESCKKRENEKKSSSLRLMGAVTGDFVVELVRVPLSEIEHLFSAFRSFYFTVTPTHNRFFYMRNFIHHTETLVSDALNYPAFCAMSAVKLLRQFYMVMKNPRDVEPMRLPLEDSFKRNSEPEHSFATEKLVLFQNSLYRKMEMIEEIDQTIPQMDDMEFLHTIRENGHPADLNANDYDSYEANNNNKNEGVLFEEKGVSVKPRSWQIIERVAFTINAVMDVFVETVKVPLQAIEDVVFAAICFLGIIFMWEGAVHYTLFHAERSCKFIAATPGAVLTMPVKLALQVFVVLYDPDKASSICCAFKNIKSSNMARGKAI